MLGNRRSVAASAVLGGLILSTIGDEVAAVALLFKVVEGRELSVFVGALFLTQLVPGVLFAPYAGRLVDERDAAGVVVWACLGQASVLCLMTMAENPSQILAGSFSLGVLFAVSGPAIFALVPIAASSASITVGQANSTLVVARGAGSLAGPLVGGALVASAGTDVALLLDAGTFGLLAILLAGSGLHRPVGTSDRDRSWGPRSMVRIYAPLLEDKLLAGLVLCLAMVVFSTSVSDVAYVFLVRDVLRGDALAYGALIACWSAGLLSGAAAMGGRRLGRAHATSAFAAAAGMGVALILTGIAPLVPLPALLTVGFIFVLGGIANGIHNVAVVTVLHERVAPALHGRAFAVYGSSARLAAGLGFGLGGAIGSLDVVVVYFASGVLAVGAGLGGAVLARCRYRRGEPLTAGPGGD